MSYLRLIFAASAVFLLAQDDCVSTQEMSIMPLGDSITDGYTAPGGYRIDLYPQLSTGGITVDFLGSLSNGPIVLPDQDHEGHSGWRIDQLQDNIAEWLEPEHPDTILLIIGTNDFLQTYEMEDAPARHDLLVGTILGLSPESHIVVASIPPLTGNPERNEDVISFNAQIQQNAEIRMQDGEPVSFVDIYSLLSAEDMLDGVHPNRMGYGKIASAFSAHIFNL